MAKIRVANAAPRFTNAEIWNVIRAKFPNFASHTSEGTAELFSERGFEALKQSDPTALNDFFGLSIRVYLNLVNISHATDRLADVGFGESFQTPYGGMIQRLATYSIKPISLSTAIFRMARALTRLWSASLSPPSGSGSRTSTTRT